MIAIFAKPPFLRTDPKTGPYVVRISSRSRGEEIADYLGANYNTERADVNIYVKPRSLKGIQDGDYVDILDDISLVPALRDRPGIKVISMSQIEDEYLRKELKNEIRLIHHHHINFEEYRNKRQPVLTGGYIGHSSHALGQFETIRAALNEVGIRFVPILSYTTREDSLAFYKQIDFLVAWNVAQFKNCVYSHPTKIINTASFGVPTLSQPIDGYKEVDDYYIHTTDLASVVREAERLKDDIYYQEWSDKVYKMAKDYHISRVAEKYYDL